MKTVAVAGLAFLTGCSGVGALQNVHEHAHQTFPAAGVRTVVIDNVSGGIVVNGVADRVTLDAEKRASGSDELARTHIVSERRGSELVIRTKYDEGGWFHHGGASVYYTVSVPPSVALQVTNVSGDVSVTGMRNDVRANTVSGGLHAHFARIAGDHRFQLRTVNGGMTVEMAKNSDVTIRASTISGDIAEFPGVSITRETVGARAHARLGRATASMDLSTVNGGITVSPH